MKSRKHWLNQKAYDPNPPRWRRMAKRHKAENPLCVQCLANGKIQPVEETDHIIPHRGNERLRYDWDNLQSLCRSCHDKKTKSGL